jgi:tripartite-type tricarboxylate transporter receptor subunit TctC
MHARSLAGLLGLLIAALGGVAAGQDYPVRPVRLVVPFPPGSPSDSLGRIVAQRLSDKLGQAVVLDNRAGAAGTVGVDIAAKAQPDGHTLLISSTGALAISPALNPRLPYDPLRDLAPISLIAYSPFIFAVGPSVPAGTFKEFVALAKAKPGQLNYASTGNGSATHLAIEQLRRITGFELTHVAYKGGGPGVIALMAGEVQAMFTGMPVLLPFVKSGKIKGIAVSSEKRSPLVPGMPTMIESGVPGYTMGLSIGILAPAKAPAAIVRRLNRDIVDILRAAEVRDLFLAQGAEPIGSAPAQYRAHMAAELKRYRAVAREAGIRLE